MKPHQEASRNVSAYAGNVAPIDRVADVRVHAGLCRDCAHAREVESDRGSRFLFCERSLVDATFPKYPRLPVLRCAGYEREPTTNDDR